MICFYILCFQKGEKERYYCVIYLFVYVYKKVFFLVEFFFSWERYFFSFILVFVKYFDFGKVSYGDRDIYCVGYSLDFVECVIFMKDIN